MHAKTAFGMVYCYYKFDLGSTHKCKCNPGKGSSTLIEVLTKVFFEIPILKG